MMTRGGGGGGGSGAKSKSAMGQRIMCILPYIKQEIPIMIVFRALGFVSDRDILEHIIYDFDDPEMMEMLKPSLDEAFVIQVNFFASNLSIHNFCLGSKCGAQFYRCTWRKTRRHQRTTHQVCKRNIAKRNATSHWYHRLL
jgi:DNA-directed RNA polymerase beta subunit